MNHIEQIQPGDARVAGWYRITEVQAPEGQLPLWHLPGVSGPGADFAALRGAVGHLRATRVFVAGPGAIASALWATQSGTTVVHWTENVAEHLSLRQTYARNNLPPPDAHVSWNFATLTPASCEVALLHLPRGRGLQAELLRVAAAVLVPGGKLVFVGARNEGIKGATAEAERIFGRAGIVSHKGGYHAGMAVNPAGPTPLPEVAFRDTVVTVSGQPTRLVSCEGVFAGDRLDVGAAALTRGMSIEPNTLVLDLGCGTGLVGLTALRRGARAVATDVSARAVATTQRTWAANGFPGFHVSPCFGATAVPDAAIDVVVTNPPFHRGYAVDFSVAQLFVAEAARVLRPGGTLYLVANAFLDYGTWLEASFRTVEIAQKDSQFRVWRAQK